jgi:hypothetical protein
MDINESYDMAASHPQVVAEIRDRMEALIATLPQAVQETWQVTMQLKVYDTPAGCLPIAVE